MNLVNQLSSQILFKKYGIIVIFVLFIAGSRMPFCRAQNVNEVEGVLTAFYKTEDIHYKKAIASIPDVRIKLTSLQGIIPTEETDSSGRVTECREAIRFVFREITAVEQTSNPITNTPEQKFGHLALLLSENPGENGGLLKVLTLCRAIPNISATQAASITTSLNNLSTRRHTMDDEFQQIDNAEALKKAKVAAQRFKEKSNCKNIKFQEEGYSVRDVNITSPFDFLPWVKDKKKLAATNINSELDKESRWFSYETVVGKASKIIEETGLLSDTTDARVKIDIQIIRAENCSETEKKLDLVYGIYTTQILPVLNSAPESRAAEKQTPQETTGVTKLVSSSPFHVTPLGGYDQTDNLSGGARFEFSPRRIRKLPFNSILIEGQASSEMHKVSASLVGSINSKGWLSQAEWSLNYSSFSIPTGDGKLKGANFSARFAGLTKPFAQGNLALRFGSLVEGGNKQSSLENPQLASNTLSSTGFGSIKLYTGLTSRLQHHVFSASYGLELGAIRPISKVDWQKHILDLRHEFWFPLGDHRILDLESRFTLGHINVKDRIPLAARFFGGNNEELFIPDDSWQIRANPVIRAIPGRKFYRTTTGDGGEHFFSYNLTAAYTIWRKPLVPEEINTDPEFSSALNDGLDSITGVVQNYYATKDAHYKTIISTLFQPVRTALEDIKQAVVNAQSARPGQFPKEFKSCLKTINTAIRRANSAAEKGKDPVAQFGNIRALLSPSADEDEDQLGQTMQCVTDLNHQIGFDSAITAAAATLSGIQANMEREFGQIDMAEAEVKAKADMAFSRRTLNTLFKDVNTFSISPVFVFDVAKIRSGNTGFDSIRYGPGGGIKFELASTTYFTIGYARNLKPGFGEGNGTIFFTFGIRDLFH